MARYKRPAGHREFVDALRNALGLAPLYATDQPTDYRTEFDVNQRSHTAGRTAPQSHARVARRMPIDR